MMNSWTRVILIVVSALLSCGIITSSEAQSTSSSTCDSYQVDQDVLVNTTIGMLKGKLVQVPGSSKLVAQFLGIPFAEAPINNLRFKDPIPKQKCSGILEAVNYGSFCIQSAPLLRSEFVNSKWLKDFKPTSQPSEDCLFLNVYAPYPFPLNATVMFYIHGGYFFIGSASSSYYNGKVLARLMNVIVVTINYRLGALGFLSSGDGRIKGNFGLKDQLLALKWVKENIHEFGGDSNSVTLFGSSAGGVSVGYHLISPQSQPYFKRAILQSGTPNAIWALMSDELVKRRFQHFLTSISCPDDENLDTCLSQIPVKDINQKQWVKDENAFNMPWFPSIDGHFLTDTPINILKQNCFKKTDIMVGVNRNEGSLFLTSHIQGFSPHNDSLQSEERYNSIIDALQPRLPDFVNEIIKYLYVDWDNPYTPENNRDGLDDLYGDWYFNCPSLEFSNFYANNSLNVYYFVFSYKSSIDFWPEWAGVVHMAELEFIFGRTFNRSLGFEDSERELSLIMMKFLTNFAKHGDPNGITKDPTTFPWPIYLPSDRSYLNILSSLHQPSEKSFRAQSCAFWNVLLPKLLKTHQINET